MANANRLPAGRRASGALTIRLVARVGAWYPETRDGPGLVVQAFGEEGRAPSIPGPLIRVREGVEIRATVRNAVPGATLVVHGLHRRPGSEADTIQVAPGATREVRFKAGVPGTYFYWATTLPPAPDSSREGEDSQLSGALVVDSAGTAPARADRVFVISLVDLPPDTTGPARTPEREALAINGVTWPYTERLDYAVGDSVRWRWINASDRPHPMHLHGFYYRVRGLGDAESQTPYGPDQHGLVVTERMLPWSTMDAEWSPNRPGNWIFHCHILFHISPALRLRPKPTTPAPGQHAAEEMAGLVLELRIRPGRHAAVRPPTTDPRQLRLLVQARPGVYGRDPGFGFVLQRGAEPPADSIAIPGSAIVLTRGEPARITVVNRLAEPTAVHWHGIELESYYDGVAGLSGDSLRFAPMIMPGDSFAAEFTPPRAGTFIYHTHVDDIRQLSLGLYGALLVLEPGQTYDPDTDRVLLLSLGGLGDGASVLLNGTVAPEAMQLRAGVRYRLRLIGIPAGGTGVISLLRGSTLEQWRALARDGADLPPPLSTLRPARQAVTVGQTFDVAYTPTAAGPLRLEVRYTSPVSQRLLEVPVRVR